MQNTNALKRQRKDELIQLLVAATKNSKEMEEKTVAAAVIGGIGGFLIGIALAAS